MRADGHADRECTNEFDTRVGRKAREKEREREIRYRWIEAFSKRDRKEQRGMREEERDSHCIEGSAFARWAAFNPVADSSLGIWTLWDTHQRKKERERERQIEGSRGGRHVRESRGLERENETDSGTNWELACNKSIHPLARVRPFALARALRVGPRNAR